jgi:hypothetical protein
VCPEGASFDDEACCGKGEGLLAPGAGSMGTAASDNSRVFLGHVLLKGSPKSSRTWYMENEKQSQKGCAIGGERKSKKSSAKTEAPSQWEGTDVEWKPLNSVTAENNTNANAHLL